MNSKVAQEIKQNMYNELEKMCEEIKRLETENYKLKFGAWYKQKPPLFLCDVCNIILPVKEQDGSYSCMVCNSPAIPPGKAN